MSSILQVGLSVDETVERHDLEDLLEIFGCTDSMVSQGCIKHLLEQLFYGFY